MKRSNQHPLFIAMSGEGENDSNVLDLDRARAWLQTQFYGCVLKEELPEETERWNHFIDSDNWSICNDGKEFEYSGHTEGDIVLRAFFITA